MSVVELENVSKLYGEVIGVNKLNLSISGGVVGLLGPNGAGKSTLIHLLSGLMRPTRGKIRIFGEAPFGNARVLRRLGLCPEQEETFDRMKARDFLRFMAGLSGMDRAAAAERTDEMLETIGLTEAAGRKIKTYSRGMKQRIKVAQALIHEPELVILDEPLNGCDPIARNDIMELVAAMAREGKTVLVSSHILNEVATMTDEILVLHRGRLLASGNVHEIRSLIDKHPHRISLRGDGIKRFAASLFEVDGVVSLRLVDAGRGLEAETKKPAAFYAAVQEAQVDGRIKLEQVFSADDNLMAVFEYLLGG